MEECVLSSWSLVLMSQIGLVSVEVVAPADIAEATCTNGESLIMSGNFRLMVGLAVSYVQK